VSLLSAFKGVKDSAMESKRNEQKSLGLTTGHDVYEVRPRKDRDGFDLISDGFRRGRIWYAETDAVRQAVAYAKYRSWSRSRRAIIRVLDDSGAVIQTHKSPGDFSPME
jgi:hypothetical protein